MRLFPLRILLLNWAAVITLVVCLAVFTILKENRFLSVNNMINILRAMSITTVFGMAATLENGLTICAVPFCILPAVKGGVLALALIAAYAARREP